MLDEIIKDLGAYYSSEDEQVLENILEEVTTNALSLSNQEEVSNLKQEIKECVKSMYLRRGTEHNNNLSANGENMNFIDPMEELRNNIIKNGKRRIY